MSPAAAARAVAARYKRDAQRAEARAEAARGLEAKLVDMMAASTSRAIADAFEWFAAVVADTSVCSDDAGCICGCRTGGGGV